MLPTIKSKALLFWISSLSILMVMSCGGGGGTAGEAASAPTTGITLSWDAPVSVEDGLPLPGLAGYYVYYGASPGQYSTVTDVGNVGTYTLTPAPGTYYFTITAYDSSGEETEFSDEVTKSAA